MSDFSIVTDSSCDLPAGLADELGLVVLPLTLNLDGREYKNYLDGRELDPHEFYERLRHGSMSTTSAANMADFEDIFEPILKSGKDILYLGFSSGLSATCQNSAIAASELLQSYPERKIYTVDTLCASMGQGLLVYLTALEKQKGQTIEQCRNFAESTKQHVVHWFTVEDLKFLWRGGRVSKTAATFGTMLDIKPILHVDNDGHLVPVAKVRGRKKSVKEVGERTIKNAIDLKNQTVFISHGDSPAEAQELAEKIRQAGAKEVVISYIGPVIGSHSGPGTMAIFSIAKEK